MGKIAISFVLAALVLAPSRDARAVLTAAQLKSPTPSKVIAMLKTETTSEVEQSFVALSPDEQRTFLRTVKTAVQMGAFDLPPSTPTAGVPSASPAVSITNPTPVAPPVSDVSPIPAPGPAPAPVSGAPQPSPTPAAPAPDPSVVAARNAAQLAQARATVEHLALFYDNDGILLETVLQNHECTRPNPKKQCASRIDGAAFAQEQRLAGTPCWKALALAGGRSSDFMGGLEDYYTRQARNGDGGLSTCVAPPEPSRCKLGFCSKFHWAGATFRPLTDFGVALPMWHPKFGFKTGQSVTLQATAGVLVRGFILDGRLDARVGFGITNAVDSDGTTSTAALAETLQIGVFDVLALGFLFVTDPRDWTTGKAVTFSIDLVSVRDLISDAAK